MATDLGTLIHEMSLEVASGPEIYRPSRYWEILASRNEAQLSSSGFEAFKRTVNQNYFNWLIAHPWDAQFLALARDWLRHPSTAVAFARLADGAGVEAGPARKHPFGRGTNRLIYSLFVAMLWDHARRRDRLHLLDQLIEPQLGAPIEVRYRGRLVTQDLANSVLEYYSISEAFGNGIPVGATIVDLGAGYGRLGWLLLQVVPDARYLAVDIPPALAIAQEYLTRLFPQLPAARFRRAGTQLERDIASSRLAFLTPNQLELLPSLNADLFINISSFHEMSLEQVAHFLDLVGRHTRGVFYMKQWRKAENPYDHVTIHRNDYGVPSAWRPVFDRQHEVETRFFEAAYEVR